MCPSSPLPQYLEEPGIYVQGTIRTDNRKEKIPDDATITMITKGSKMELFSESAGKDGAFTFLLRDFKDTLRAVVQTKNSLDIKKDYQLDLFTNYYKRPSDQYQKLIYPETDSVITPIIAETNLDKGMLTKTLERSLTVDTFIMNADVVIDEVTVSADKPRTNKEN